MTIRKSLILILLLTFLSVHVYSQITASFTKSPIIACSPQTLLLKSTSIGTGSLTYKWFLGKEDTIQTLNDSISFNVPIGKHVIKLLVTNGVEKDSATDIITIGAFASFSIPDSVVCLKQNIVITNKSINDTTVWWSYGDIRSTNDPSPAPYNYNFPGNDTGWYTIRLIVNPVGACKDTAIKKVHVINTPTAKLVVDNDSICAGSSTMLHLTTSTSEFPNWQYQSGTLDFKGDYYNPMVYPKKKYTYSVRLKDDGGCTLDVFATINVVPADTPTYSQMNPENINLSDTTVIIGNEVQLDIFSTETAKYVWTSNVDLTCMDCPTQIVRPLKTTTYQVTVSDFCFSNNHFFTVNVEEKFSLSMPKAFTPNGDGINDILPVQGWGIKQLMDFSIFDRWGSRVYQSSDINAGWDGHYNGKLQPADNYTYFVKILTYGEKEMYKEGSITLIR